MGGDRETSDSKSRIVPPPPEGYHDTIPHPTPDMGLSESEVKEVVKMKPSPASSGAEKETKMEANSASEEPVVSKVPSSKEKLVAPQPVPEDIAAMSKEIGKEIRELSDEEVRSIALADAKETESILSIYEEKLGLPLSSSFGA